MRGLENRFGRGSIRNRSTIGGAINSSIVEIASARALANATTLSILVDERIAGFAERFYLSS
jgi:hypothetical protein